MNSTYFIENSAICVEKDVERGSGYSLLNKIKGFKKTHALKALKNGNSQVGILFAISVNVC